ncbi:hypothetical protein TRFO_27880 [Tritrichomonas foetus]|uniref:Ras-GEF domain-containing protein n=1 Tax=Tritrichomonas foetus TaxID=1144522 RepID=A0A1J4K4Y9_9EUKA|nr:hypothetical protein TRFO_27880 [Tritrichomonas foetus]|eukprot:OHT04565.1 hypothetical protein TRFO_27880 [Tritrichomonas foetus]
MKEINGRINGHLNHRMNVSNFLTEQCTKVTLKDGLTFVDSASYRALIILIFHPSMEKEINHLYHKQLIFAWHNLELPLVDLVNHLIEIIDEYQHGKLSKKLLIAPPEHIYKAGLDFVHVWLCSFLHRDFVGKANEENRQNLKNVLRKLAELIDRDFDTWFEEEEEEEEEEPQYYQHSRFSSKKISDAVSASSNAKNDARSSASRNYRNEDPHEEEEEDPNIFELGVSMGEIKLYLENLDQNEPVVEVPPNMQRPVFDPEEVKYKPTSKKPFPLRATPEVISEHFFYTGLRILSKITYEEYVKCAWTATDKDIKEQQCPNISKLEDHFETTMNIINDSILTTADLNLRLEVIERWIDIMEAAINSHNYLFAFEIAESLNKLPISMQKSTWRDIKPDYQTKYNRLQEFTSTYKRYAHYKNEMRDAPVRQTLPFINPWLTEMYLTEKGHPNFKRLPNGEEGVNFAKQFAYYTSVEYLRQPWGADAAFLLNDDLLADIEEYSPRLGGDEQVMRMSKVVERSVVFSPSPSPRK